MKKRIFALMALAFLMVTGLSIDLSREEKKATAPEAREYQETPAQTILGQIIYVAGRDKKTDPFVIRLKFYPDESGRDSTITLTAKPSVLAQKIEAMDYCLASFQAIDGQNQILNLEKLNLWQHRMEVQKNGKTTLWLYSYNDQKYIARVSIAKR